MIYFQLGSYLLYALMLIYVGYKIFTQRSKKVRSKKLRSKNKARAKILHSII